MILGVFPHLQRIGGAEASGRIAWQPFDGKGYLFCYGGPAASTKPGAIFAALRRRWPVNVVLVWHLGLLKLIPFFRVSGARLVVFLHGIEAWKAHGGFTRRLLRRVDLFLSNSEFTWQRFLSFCPECRNTAHRTVHLGFGEPRAGDVQPQGAPAALMLGRLSRAENYKGHAEIIDAWPLVMRSIPAAQLWIAGPGKQRADLEALVRARSLDGSVRFFGEITEQQKEELLERCRCFALPSRGEGFGLVYLEAMRMGRPCLVSTFDAGREVVNPPEAGLAVDPADSSAVAGALCRLLAPGVEWDAWSRSARARYAASFTAEHFQQRLCAAIAI